MLICAQKMSASARIFGNRISMMRWAVPHTRPETLTDARLRILRNLAARFLLRYCSAYSRVMDHVGIRERRECWEERANEALSIGANVNSRI